MDRTDAELAAQLAHEAGRMLIDVRRQHDPELGTATLKDTADLAAQEFLGQALAGARPNDAVLSEEAEDDHVRLNADRVWIIDPLDGTSDYAHGRSEFAVHVALWEDGRLAAGAVAVPDRNEVLRTDAPVAVAPMPDRRVKIAVSRSRATPLTQRVATALDAELVPLGSAGYKVASILLGEVDAYVHSGGQYEWDSAAPVAVAEAAGLFASRVDGGKLRYNQPDPYLPDLVVSRPELAGPILAACAGDDLRPTTPI
jgi:3'(2'), 5'-bisphosphate nucleotidase